MVGISKWIQSWLTDRKQRVIVNNVTFDWIPVISGVPQGSVLGPCLFVRYINDIDDAVSSKILKFADDTKSTASISSVEEQNIIQTDLTWLMEWSEERDLGVTIHKSLKPSCHIAQCVKRANQMLGMIRRFFQYKDRKTMLLL